METLKEKKKLEFPQTMVLLVLLALVISALTYIIPAGVYEKGADGKVDAASFHYIEQTPVSPWGVVLRIAPAISSVGMIFALLLVIGSLVNLVVASGAVENLVDFSMERLKDKSLIVMIPVISILMSLLGGLAGQDSLIAFVACGMLLARKSKLDRIAGLAIFYLPYITAQAVGPTSILLLMCQEMTGLPLVSGAGLRIVLWIVFTAFCIFYNTRYALKVARDPSKSLDHEILQMEGGSQTSGHTELKTTSVVAIVLMMVPFVIYAIGSSNFGWGMEYLIGIAFLFTIVISFVFHYSPNEWSRKMMDGTKAMAPVCFMIGFARLVGLVLTDGQIVYTITHAAISLFAGFGASVCAIGMFLFITLFNLLIPSGPAKIPIVMPLFIPMADIMGITRQLLCMCYQLGDGLTNFLTPVSSVLAAGLALSGAKYSKWMKYAVPYALILITFSFIIVVLLQKIGWTGL